jgi:hypothetical protein
MTTKNQDLITYLRYRLIAYMIGFILLTAINARDNYLIGKSPWLQVLCVGLVTYALSLEVSDLVLERRANGPTKRH